MKKVYNVKATCHCEEHSATRQSHEIASHSFAMTEQCGRSMVEMLGVLAVMGVLSVAGIAGYNNAMNKHRANELLNEASKRATVVAMQMASGRGANIDEFKVNGTQAFTVSGEAGDTTFTLTIANVDEAVCKQIVNAAGTSGMVRKITSGGTDTAGDASKCISGALVLTYNADLSNKDISSETGNGAGTCAINPETDCLSKALVEGECACAPATDETECTSWTTNECGKGKYCVFSVNSCTTDPTSGTCQDVGYIGGEKTATVETDGEDVEYTMSDCSNCPDWWSAQSWCKAHNKTMVSLSDLHCTSKGCTDTLWQDLGNALYQYSTWTTDMYDSCDAFFVYLDVGNVYGSRRDDTNAVLCRE